MECNQGQGFTACGVDALMVVCTYDPAVMGSCLHDSGPCVAGMKKQGSVGECQGRSQYTAHLLSEKKTRPTHEDHQAHAALSIFVEAMRNITYRAFDSAEDREAYFHQTLDKARAVAPHTRFTTMKVVCAWCDTPKGDKEGNGATGETSTICPSCFETQMGKNTPAEVRRIAASIYNSIGEPAPYRVTSENIGEFRRTLGEAIIGAERGEPAEVAASAGSCMVGIALGE